MTLWLFFCHLTFVPQFLWLAFSVFFISTDLVDDGVLLLFLDMEDVDIGVAIVFLLFLVVEDVDVGVAVAPCQCWLSSSAVSYVA